MSKTRSASSNLGDSVIQAGQLQDSSYKNQASLPTQSENDAQLFADIGKSFSAPGDRPRGGARNLGAGFAKGMEYGAKSNAISEKKENFGKYQKQMDYLKSVQGEVVKQNQWHAEQEKRLETVRPFAVGGLEISYSGMDYATGNDRMRNVMEQAKLADPTIKGDYIGYVPNSPIVNMRDQDGNIIAYSLSNLAGEDVVKRVQENYIKQQQSNTSNDAIDVKKYKEGIPGGAYGTKSDNFSQDGNQTLEIDGTQYRVGDLSQLEKSARAHYQKKVNDSQDAIPKNNQALEAIETMREVFDRNPNIGTSFINLLDDPDGIDAGWNIIARKLAGKDLDDMQILKKATNDLNLDTILGITGKAATDLLKKAVQAASPSGKLSKVAFDKNAKTWEDKARANNRLITAKYEAMLKGKSLAENPRGSGSSKQVNGSGSSASQDGWSNIWKPIS